jgi:hypothetical protein
MLFAARHKPVSEGVPIEDRGFRLGVARWRVRDNPPSAQLGLESVDHHAAACGERFARAPEIVSTDAAETSIRMVTSEAVDFQDEVRIAIVDGGAPSFLTMAQD